MGVRHTSRGSVISSTLKPEAMVLSFNEAEHRIVSEEVRQAVRGAGVGDLSMVAAVVLETDGSLSVIQRSQMGSGDALVGIDPGRGAGDEHR